MEVIVKMLKKREKVRGEGGMCTKNGSYCEKEKKSVGGGGGEGGGQVRGGGGVRLEGGGRVDGNGELKLL